MTLHFINYIGWLVIPGKAVGCCGDNIHLIGRRWLKLSILHFFFSSSSRQETVWLIIQIKFTKNIEKGISCFCQLWLIFSPEWNYLRRSGWIYICLTMPLYYFPHFEYFWFHCNVGLKIYLQNYRKGVLMDKIIEYKILQHLSYYTTYSDNDNDLSIFVE